MTWTWTHFWIIYTGFGLGAAFLASKDRDMRTIPWPLRFIPLFLALVFWPTEAAAFIYYIYVTYLRRNPK